MRKNLIIIILALVFINIATVYAAIGDYGYPKEGAEIASQTIFEWAHVVGSEKYILKLYDENQVQIATYTTKSSYYKFQAPEYVPSNAKYWETSAYSKSWNKWLGSKRKSFSVSETILLEGKGTENDPYLVYLPEHFNIINDNFTYPADSIPEKKIYFKQIRKITLEKPVGGIPTSDSKIPEKDINYIKEKGHFFSGVYDGNSYDIGLEIKSKKDFAGIFALAKNAEIKNVKAYGLLYGKNYVGCIAGFCLENCEISKCRWQGIALEGNNYVGTIAGYLGTNSKIVDCSSSGNCYANTKYLGGIVGYCASNVKIIDCISKSDVMQYRKQSNNISYIIPATVVGSTPKKSTNLSYFGGIAGYAENNCSFTNCTNDMITQIKFNDHIGGIAGHVENNCSFENCENKSYLFAQNNIGGIVSACGANCSFDNCVNNGGIKAQAPKLENKAITGYIGGIVGIANEKCILNTCVNKNVINVTNQNSGGIIGLCLATKHNPNTLESEINLDFKNDSTKIVLCSNFASIEGDTDYLGGIVGRSLIPIVIKNCSNENKVHGSNGSNIGGIIGSVHSQFEIDYCKNSVINKSKFLSYSPVEKNGVKGYSNIGGIIGFIDPKCKLPCKISNCENSASINANGNNIGGIIGSNDASVAHTITFCSNTGDINGKESVGGIAGICKSSKFSNTANKGEINGINYVGGQVGSCGNCFFGKNCKNSSRISAEDGYAGSLAGSDDGKSKIANYINESQHEVKTKKVKQSFTQSILGFGTLSTTSSEYIGIINEKK